MKRPRPEKTKVCLTRKTKVWEEVAEGMENDLLNVQGVSSNEVADYEKRIQDLLKHVDTLTAKSCGGTQSDGNLTG